MKSDTEMVSPVELHIGDHVQRHGALFEVMHIVESECDIPGGIRVAACISRVIGDVTGNIPRGWLETPKRMAERGVKWATSLPEGLYFNIQGNAHAKVSRVIRNVTN